MVVILRERLIIFDLLRIIAILLVVIGHITAEFGITGFYGIQNFDYTSIAGIGVIIFLIVSGSTLTISHPRISLHGYKDFMTKRLVRIYPAYWITIFIAILVFYLFLYNIYNEFTLSNYILTFSGFFAFLSNQFGGPILAVGWYIGLIVSLYALYPFVARLFDRNPHIAILILLIVSIASRLCCGYLQAHDIGSRLVDWFPLCRLFEFGLGIYIIRTGLYPKDLHISRKISSLIMYGGELSFYVFLVHYTFIDMRLFHASGLTALVYFSIMLLVVIPILSISLFVMDSQLHKLAIGNRLVEKFLSIK